MIDHTVDKIKKLLALAHDKGATEHEAAQALEMASALMTKYGVEQSQLIDKPNVMLHKITVEGAEDKWHGWLLSATGMLVTVRPVIYGGGTFAFIGRESNVSAAAAMFPWLVEQVERLYKRDLPKGMTKKARADYRRTFKQACAVRVYRRAEELRHAMTSDNATAQAATGSTALIVRNSTQQQLDAIAEYMRSIGYRTKPGRTSKVKFGLGTGAGLRAGNEVQINRQLGGKRLAITSRH